MGCGCKKRGGVHNLSPVKSCHTIEVRYLGSLPFSIFAEPSNERYVWSEMKPIRPIYECDMQSVMKQTGGKIEVVGDIVGITFIQEEEDNGGE